MLLAEELLLLGLDPVTGRIVNGARQQLLVGLAGALIGELALAGSAELSAKRFVAVGPEPEHPLLARAHRSLAEPTRRRAPGQLRRIDKAVGGIWSQLVDGLVEQAVLGRRRDRVLLISVTRHPVLAPAARDEPLHRMQLAATGDNGLEARTAVLLALAGPSRLLQVIAPDRADRRHAKRRIKTATELTPVAPVVRKVIAEMQAAAAATAVTVSSASATSS
ncbi:MAG: GPP34 family phosphoprotein [Jatrophihabitantaceae bacterium]